MVDNSTPRGRERHLDDGLGTIALVPPRRLGRVLQEHRIGHGESLDVIARRSEGRVTVDILDRIENGETFVDDARLSALLDLYDITPSSPVPERSRLVIDLDGGLLQVDGRHARLGRRSGRRDVLLPRYLSMVYSMRGIEPGQRIPLRVDDLDVLGRALRLGTDSVRSDLNVLMERDAPAVRERTRLLSRRVMLPAAGVIVGLCGVGTVLLVSTGDGSVSLDGASLAAQSTANHVDHVGHTVAPAVDVEIGTAVVQERLPDGTPGPVVERTGA